MKKWINEEIDTKNIIDKWEKELTDRIEKLNMNPNLSIIKVGNKKESSLYVNNKIKKAEKLGIKTSLLELPEYIKQEELNEILKLMMTPTILQLPLPEHINTKEALSNLSYKCDVDGLTTQQKGLLAEGSNEAFVPATAAGVIRLIESIRSIKKSKVVIISRSDLIGLPLTHCVLKRDGYPVVLHSRINNYKIKKEMRSADIIVTGCGRRNIFDKSYVSDGQVIIDCSMASVEGVKGVGDFNKEDILENTNNFIASGFGHTGPATIMGLMDNVVKYYEMI